MYIVDHPLYPYIVDVCLLLICYGLYKFETTVECSTLLFSLGTDISFSSLFLNVIKVVQSLLCCWFIFIYI